jgi:hypothetical protein
LPGVKPLCEVIFSLVSLKPASTVFFSFSRQKIIQISYMALKKDSGNLAVRLL